MAQSEKSQPAETSNESLRQQTESQLQNALKLQSSARLQAERSDGDDEYLIERQRLLDRVVVLYQERLRILEQVDALKKSTPDSAFRQGLVAEFSASPPYDVLRVDLLRDELESIQERQGSVKARQSALKLQKDNFLQAKHQLSEAFRLADDRFARAMGNSEAEALGRHRTLAELRVKLADGELSNVALEEDAASEEAKAYSNQITELGAIIKRAVAGQILSQAALDMVKSQLNSGLEKIAAETDAIISANANRAKERESLTKAGKHRALTQSEERQFQLLEAQMESARIQLITLGWLRSLSESISSAWSKRFVAQGGVSASVREDVLIAFTRMRTDLKNRMQLFEEVQGAANSAVRQQELRINRSALDQEAKAHETALLEVLKWRVQSYQRVGLAASKFDHDLQRWQDDLGTGKETDHSVTLAEAKTDFNKLAKSFWNFELFAVEETTVVEGKLVSVSYGVTVGKSVGVMVLFALGYIVFSISVRWLENFLVRRFAVDEQLALVIRRWLMVLLMIGLIIFVLNLARIPLTVFAFMGGALAIGIGFGTQTIIKNFISGIIILFERKIRVGDIVELNGMTGHVTAVDMRASTVRGFDGVEALVPNSVFLENQIVNWTYSNPRIRREVRVGVAYGTPVRQAAEIIAECAEDHGEILKNPKPEVFLEDFGDNALSMALIFWVEMRPGFSARRVDSDLRFAIEKRLGDAKISIPFPQRDLHVDIQNPIRVELEP